MKRIILILLTLFSCSILAIGQSFDKDLERLEEIRLGYGELSHEYFIELNSFCNLLEKAEMTNSYEYYTYLYELYYLSNYYDNNELTLQIVPKLEPLVYKFAETPKDAFLFILNVGNINAFSGYYNEAIRYYDEAFSLLPKVFSGDTLLLNQAHIMVACAEIYNVAGDEQEALKCIKEAEERLNCISKEVLKHSGRTINMSYYYILFRLFKCAYQLGDYNMVFIISPELEQMIGKYSDNSINDAIWYVSCMYSASSKMDRCKDALFYCNELISLLSTEDNKEMLMAALTDKAEILSTIGRKEESLACIKDCKRLIDESQITNRLVLQQIAVIEGGLVNEYDEAMSKFDTALFLCKQQFDVFNAEASFFSSNSEFCIDSIYSIAESNNNKEAVEDLEKLWLYLSAILSHKSMVQVKFGKITEAYQTALQGRHVLEQNKLKNNISYLNCLLNITSYQLYFGNYSDAINTIDSVKVMIEDIYGKNNGLYAMCLMNYSLYYNNTGVQEEALRFGEEANQVIKNLYGNSSDEYYYSLVHMGNLLLSYHNPQKTLRYLSEAVDIVESNNDLSYSLNTCDLYISLSRALLELGQIEEGLLYYGRAKEMIAVDYGLESKKYAHLLFYYGYEMLNYKNGENVSFESFWTSANIMNSLGYTYDPLYYLSLLWYGVSGFKYDKTIVSDYILTMNKAVKDYYTNSILFYSSKERDQALAELLDAKNVLFGVRMEENSKHYLYDYLLFSKSIMLATSNSFRDAIYNTSQQDLINQYNDILAIQRVINNQSFGQMIENHSPEMLFDRKTSMERKLIAEMKSLGYSVNDSITYDDVAKSLKPNETAIEFVDYYHLKDKKTYYVALLAKSSWDKPVYVQLCTEDELKACLGNPNVTYSTDDLYRLLWQPLLEYVGDSCTVYFSPSGMLHTIALESIHTPDGSCLSDKYNLVRLTSTRELCKTKKPKTYETGAIYGGLQYDVEQQRMAEVAAMNKTELEESPAFALRGEDRGNWNYLPGTLAEAEHIAGIMRQANIGCGLYEGDLGSEESFKALSGGNTDIIHLATHGYFIESEKADLNDFMNNLSPLAIQKADSIIDPLLRSGLILSGGNNAWLGKEVPEGIEDGVLTALEISTMNLSGTDMVVMSACETGLGDITSDGVFGLQRAFKMAGVQTLVMSFWKVDDNATSLMMQTFYEQLFSGKTKREAFGLAQAAVRNKYPEPYYWAGFVMLD